MDDPASVYHRASTRKITTRFFVVVFCTHY